MDENKPEKCYVHIHGKSIAPGIFDVKFNGYSYGYLMESARQGITDNIEGFCTMLYAVVNQVFTDEGLANDLIKAVSKYQERLMNKAEGAAKNVTESEELASQAFMEDVVARSQMSKKEAKKASEEEKAILREVLNEDKEGEE